MTERLGRIAAVTLMAGTVAVLATTVLTGFAPALRAKFGWSKATSPAAYAVGQSFDVPAIVYSTTDRTLVVFASGTCSACLKSAQALSGLFTDFRDSPTRVVLVTPATMAADQEAFVQGLGVPASQHLTMNTSGLRLKVVPTTVLVDRLGTVLYAREGLIDDAGRQAIRLSVDGPRS